MTGFPKGKEEFVGGIINILELSIYNEMKSLMGSYNIATCDRTLSLLDIHELLEGNHADDTI